MDELKELADKLNEAYEYENSPGMKGTLEWKIIWDLLIKVVPFVLKKLI